MIKTRACHCISTYINHNKVWKSSPTFADNGSTEIRSRQLGHLRLESHVRRVGCVRQKLFFSIVIFKLSEGLHYARSKRSKLEAWGNTMVHEKNSLIWLLASHANPTAAGTGAFGASPNSGPPGTPAVGNTTKVSPRVASGRASLGRHYSRWSMQGERMDGQTKAEAHRSAHLFIHSSEINSFW